MGVFGNLGWGNFVPCRDVLCRVVCAYFVRRHGRGVDQQQHHDHVPVPLKLALRVDDTAGALGNPGAAAVLEALGLAALLRQAGRVAGVLDLDGGGAGHLVGEGGVDRGVRGGAAGDASP